MTADEIKGEGRLRRLVLYSYCGLVFLFLILPNFIVIPISFSPAIYLEFPPRGISFQWYQKYFSQPGWIAATVTSFEVAIPVMILATTLGSLAAYGLVRGKYPGKNFVNSLILFPMVIPSLVTAVAIYKLYSDLKIIGTVLGFVLAHTVLAIPFVVVIMTASLRGIDMELELAARSLGAGRLTTLRRVVFPLALPGLLSSALFSFLVSFDELMVALFISTPAISTLPKKLWDGIRTEINPTLAAVSSLLVVLSVLVIMGAYLAQRHFERRSK